MPSSLTILLIIIAIMAVLTWFLSLRGLYRGIWDSASKIPKDLDVLIAPFRLCYRCSSEEGSLIKASAAIDLSLLHLIVGGFLGIVNKTELLLTWGLPLSWRSMRPRKMLILVLVPLLPSQWYNLWYGEEIQWPSIHSCTSYDGRWFISLTGVAIICSVLKSAVWHLLWIHCDRYCQRLQVGTGDSIVLQSPVF